MRLLLHVIQKTLELEQELKAKFTVAPTSIPETACAPQTRRGKGGHGALGGEGGGAGARGDGGVGGGLVMKNGQKVFDRIISRIFKPYMSLYLKLERAHMVDLVKRLLVP